MADDISKLIGEIRTALVAAGVDLDNTPDGFHVFGGQLWVGPEHWHVASVTDYFTTDGGKLYVSAPGVPGMDTFGGADRAPAAKHLASYLRTLATRLEADF